MQAIIVKPTQALKGTIQIPGSKNSSLALLAAACLSDEPVLLQNVPHIADVQVFKQIADEIGIRMIQHAPNEIYIDPIGIHSTIIDSEKASTFRTSYYFVGALLAKYGKVTVGYPGGD